MKVVHIIDSGGVYGAEMVLIHLCNAQKLLDLCVEVISIGKINEGEKDIERVLKNNGISVIPWRMRSLPDLYQGYRILEYCRDNKVEVVHSHGYKSNIILGLMPKRLRKIPVVCTHHGYTSQSRYGKMGIYQWLDFKCLQRLDGVVLLNSGVKDTFQRVGRFENLTVIANGIPEKDRKLSIDSYFGNNQRKITIGSVGRLSTEKNFSLLIRSMRIVVDKHPESKLVILGEGKERDGLIDLINSLGLTNCVFLPGYGDTSSFFHELTVFVNSSISEGMPVTILEALKEGVPVVATDIAANQFLLEVSPKVASLTSFSETQMAEKITEFIDLCQTDREEISNKAKSFFKENFTDRKMADLYFSFYTSVIKGR